MANIITAGNSTNGGTAITTDASGTLNIVTGSGSGANAITIDASQNVTFANAITTTGNGTIGGALSVTGNATITGTLTATGGVSGGIRSGTAVSASGTSVDFTGIPSSAKRITVMFSGVSTSGTSNYLIQIGAGSVTTSGYLSNTTYINDSPSNSCAGTSSTQGFIVAHDVGSPSVMGGSCTITTLGSNIWAASGVINRSSTANGFFAGTITLGGTLDRVRITTANGSDTFDAGTINILYE